MWYTSLFSSLKRSARRYRESRPRCPKTQRNGRKERQSFAPRLESLEDRTLLSTLTVLNNHDNGPGSLRAAIAAAGSGDTIQFSSAVKGQTITLTSGELAITTTRERLLATERVRPFLLQESSQKTSPQGHA